VDIEALYPIAYLTCEVKARDLVSRMLIAAHLIKRGYSVVVGQQWGCFESAAHAVRGAYLFKTTNKFQAKMMKHVRDAGHIAVASDEEAMVSAAALAAEKTHPSAVENCDHYLALSALHADSLRAHFPAFTSKFELVGSARIDLVRQAKRSRPHKRSYVLFNTSFGIINGLYGDFNQAAKYYFDLTQADPNNPDDIAAMRLRIDYETAAHNETLKLISAFLEKTDHDIVIRPHPAEQPDMWQQLLQKNPNRISVVTGSDPVQWIKYAHLMLHSDSTTGVEAAILGKPAINVSPIEAWSRKFIVRDMNVTVANAEQAFELGYEALRFPERTKLVRNADNVFPRNGAEATARAIARFLPPPAELPRLEWTTILHREEILRNKFTVTPDEFQEAIQRTFSLAGASKPTVVPCDDSVVLLVPRR